MLGVVNCRYTFEEEAFAAPTINPAPPGRGPLFIY